MRNQRGITLIALIITIIVMLILVGVTVNVALNGGLFTTAKKAANETQIATEQETLLSAVIATMTDGKVDFEKLDNNLPKGFTGNKGKYKSEKGNKYRVYKDGEVEYSREPDEPTPIYASLEDNNDGEGTKTLVFTVAENTNEGVINLGQVLDKYSTGEGYSMPAWYTNTTYRTSITKVEFRDIVKPNFSTSFWFYQLKNLTEIDNIENLYTGSVTEMFAMFMGCTKLSSIDLTRFDTGNLRYVTQMFRDCKSLEKLNLSQLDISNLNEISYMFTDCSQLRVLELPSINTGNILRMSYLFAGCRNLEKLDLEEFNTKGVNAINGMFKDCTKIKAIITLDQNSIKDLHYTDGHIEPGYVGCFEYAATEPGAKITVRCGADQKDKVQEIIDTKSANSNVVLEVID